MDRLRETVHHDWKRSRPLDLSERGLLTDLEDRADAAEQLGIIE